MFKTKLLTHALLRNAQALSLAKLTYTNKKQRMFIRNFFSIRLINKPSALNLRYSRSVFTLHIVTQFRVYQE